MKLKTLLLFGKALSAVSAFAQDSGKDGSGSGSGYSSGQGDGSQSDDKGSSQDDKGDSGSNGDSQDDKGNSGSGDDSGDKGDSKSGSGSSDGSSGLKRGPLNQRTFRYTSRDLINEDFSGAGDVFLKVRTRINVNPYLYIAGNFGAEWVVNGWGTGTDTRTETVMVYHDETLTLDFEDFGRPKKKSGTKTGAQEVGLGIQVKFANAQKKSTIFSTGMVEASDVNGVFNPSGPSFGAGATDGLMQIDITRRITINPNVGPGVYENLGLIKVIRN